MPYYGGWEYTHTNFGGNADEIVEDEPTLASDRLRHGGGLRDDLPGAPGPRGGRSWERELLRRKILNMVAYSTRATSPPRHLNAPRRNAVSEHASWSRHHDRRRVVRPPVL